MQKPWITPYAGERHIGPFAYDGQRIFFPDRVEDRELGVLWQPAPENSDGEIWWSEMHTGRQKRAMLDGLCQVCGQPMGEPPWSWLIPGVEVAVVRPRGRPFQTVTPPTCQQCVPIALSQCPNLKFYPPLLLTVNAYRPVAVYGDLVGRHGRLVRAEVALSSSSELPRIMARHLVVEIYDYRRARAS